MILLKKGKGKQIIVFFVAQFNSFIKNINKVELFLILFVLFK